MGSRHSTRWFPGFLLAVGAVLMSCGNHKSTTRPPSEAADIFVPVYPVSARTKMFLNALEKELGQQGVPIEEYVPSTAFREAYVLHQENDRYHFSGMLKVSGSFDAAQLTRLGGNVGSMAGDIATVSIPLSAIHDFLRMQGVAYFQLAERVTPH